MTLQSGTKNLLSMKDKTTSLTPNSYFLPTTSLSGVLLRNACGYVLALYMYKTKPIQIHVH